MVKINFQNNITKANADTFNTMQDNIEDAINKIGTIKQGFGDIFISNGTYFATIFSNLVATYIGNSLWRIDFDAKLEYSTTPGSEYYIWGFSIDKIGTLLNLNLENPTSTYNKLSSCKSFSISNGTMQQTKFGYAPIFEYYSDYNRLLPARIYNTSGSIGGWGLSNYSSGDILTGTIYLKEQ